MNVTIIAAVTADGKIAEEADQVSLEWTSKADKRFFVKKTKEAGVLVMGRKTFETIGKPLPGRLSVVMTRHPEKYESEPKALRFTNDSPREIVEQLKYDGYEEVIVAGGAQIYSMFLDAGLVTDVFLTVEPVLFGRGVPFVKDIDPVKMELEEVERLGENAVLVHYEIK